MTPISHISNTHVLNGPADKPEIMPVCATLEEYVDYQVIKTYWKPTVEELKTIAKGGDVVVSILGTSLPAMKLSVELTFRN